MEQVITTDISNWTGSMFNPTGDQQLAHISEKLSQVVQDIKSSDGTPKSVRFTLYQACMGNYFGQVWGKISYFFENSKKELKHSQRQFHIAAYDYTFECKIQFEEFAHKVDKSIQPIYKDSCYQLSAIYIK